MKAALLIAATMLCLALPGVPPRSHAAATASASGSFGDVGFMRDDHSGLVTASAAVSNVSEAGDNFGATASVNGTTLRVTAYSFFFPGGFGAVSSATATWEDRLTIINPEVLLGAPRRNEIVAFFFPVAMGMCMNGRADFSAAVQLRDGTFASQEGTSFSSAPIHLALQLPATDLLPFGGDDRGLAFQMNLGAETFNTLLPGQGASVDYSHTAILPPILFAYADGTPVPGLEGLRVVGESGFEYAVTTVVPEPSTGDLALGGAGLLGLMARRRRGAKG